MEPMQAAPWLANEGMKEIRDGFRPGRGQL
jgi:hypothetical protein